MLPSGRMQNDYNRYNENAPKAIDSKSVVLKGIPYDGGSSFMRGPALAPARRSLDVGGDSSGETHISRTVGGFYRDLPNSGTPEKIFIKIF